VSTFDDEWSRSDAESKISTVLNAAKSGYPQRIVDFDGTFEVTFLKAKTGLTVAEVLAKGGPPRK
jgi:hypothetical protein